MKIIQLFQDESLKHKKVLEKILCHLLQYDKAELIMHHEDELDIPITEKIIDMYKQYSEQKKPLEYILGYVEFFGNRFYVDQNTLIPRPETEYMITTGRELYQPGMQLIDVGTGCGVLGLSLCLFIQTRELAFLSEYYEGTLEVAKQNYESYKDKIQTPITFVQSDLLTFAFNEDTEKILKNKPHMIVANLPYIPEDTFDNDVEENVKNREPRPAFVAGKDGLDLYRIFLDQIEKGITQSIFNKTDIILCEMMTRQAEKLEQEFAQKRSFHHHRTFHFNIVITQATYLG